MFGTPPMTSPYAPHTDAETEAMLDAVGVEREEDLFDIGRMPSVTLIAP